MDFTGVIYVAPYKWRYFSLLISGFWDQLVLGMDFFGCLRLPARVEKHQELASKTFPTRLFGCPLLGEPNPNPEGDGKKKHVELPLVLRHGAWSDELWNAHPLLPLPKPTWTSSRSGKKLVTAAVNRIYPPPPAGHEGVFFLRRLIFCYTLHSGFCYKVLYAKPKFNELIAKNHGFDEHWKNHLIGIHSSNFQGRKTIHRLCSSKSGTKTSGGSSNLVPEGQNRWHADTKR